MKVECDQSWIVPCVHPVSSQPSDFTRVVGLDRLSAGLAIRRLMVERTLQKPKPENAPSRQCLCNERDRARSGLLGRSRLGADPQIDHHFDL
jgi:hypothetical protein